MKKSAREIPPGKKLAVWEHPILVCVGLAVLTLAVFWPVIHCDFTNYDDPNYFSANQHVLTGLTWDNVKWAFSTIYTGYWQPLNWLSFMLDVSLFGTGAAGPHFTNLLLHTTNAVLLFLLLRMLTGTCWRSAAVAGLFTLHPLRVESVAWVCERKDVLSALFGLLTLWAYGRYAKSATQNPKFDARNYFLALLFLALGLMSKAMLVTLPCVMLLLDYWPLHRIEPGFRRPHVLQLLRLIWEKSPFFVLSAIFSGLTLWAQRDVGAVAELAGLPAGARMENAVVSYMRYLGKTFWPTNLANPYPHPGYWPWVTVMTAVAVVAGLCLAALWFGRTRRYLLAGWFCFWGMLFPVIGLTQSGIQAMADRFTYLPSIGLFIALVWWLGGLMERWRWPRFLLGAGLALVLALCGARTANQIKHWRNSETLFRHALAVTEKNYVAHANLGWHLAGTGRADEAVEQFRQALALYPDYFEAFNGLGYTLATMGFLDEAIANCRRAVQINPKNESALNNLGYALFNQGAVDEAIGLYREALRINPEYADAWNNLGYALSRKGQYAEALKCYEAALRANPAHVEAQNNLGIVLDEFGRLDEAVTQYRQVLERKPDHAGAHGNLGIALARLGKLDESAIHLRIALQAKPNDAAAHNNLANVLGFQTRFDEAIAEYNEALRLNPQYAEAHNNLGSALVKLNRREEAISHLREALRLKPDYAEAKRQLRELGVETPE